MRAVLLRVTVQSLCSIYAELAVCRSGIDNLPSPDQCVVLRVSNLSRLVCVDGRFDVHLFRLEFRGCKRFFEVFDALEDDKLGCFWVTVGC